MLAFTVHELPPSVLYSHCCTVPTLPLIDNVPPAGAHNVLLAVNVPATVVGSTVIVIVFDNTAVHGALVTLTLYVEVVLGDILVREAINADCEDCVVNEPPLICNSYKVLPLVLPNEVLMVVVDPWQIVVLPDKVTVGESITVIVTALVYDAEQTPLLTNARYIVVVVILE